MQTTLILPPRVVGYIASFIKTNFEADLLLNMYKAFEIIECEGYEDPLSYYKDNVQSYIAYLVEDGVIFDERDANCGLTRRDIMYLFDCLYCESTVIMYGEATYEDIGYNMSIVNTDRMRHIDNEFLDCSEYTETLANNYPLPNRSALIIPPHPHPCRLEETQTILSVIPAPGKTKH